MGGARVACAAAAGAAAVLHMLQTFAVAAAVSTSALVRTGSWADTAGCETAFVACASASYQCCVCQ